MTHEYRYSVREDCPMLLTSAELLDLEGNIEAVAFAKDKEGNLLPPGTWRVEMRSGAHGIVTVEFMPVHWVEQLNRGWRYGQLLDKEGTGNDYDGEIESYEPELE